MSTEFAETWRARITLRPGKTVGRMADLELLTVDNGTAETHCDRLNYTLELYSIYFLV